MKLALALVLAVTGCLSQEPEPAEADTTQALIGGGNCPDWGCGTNSPQINNLGFHELNLDGVANLEGFSITGVTHGTANYQMLVYQGKIYLYKVRGSGSTTDPDTLHGLGLANTHIYVQDKDGKKIDIWIQSVQLETAFWAHNAPGGPQILESYVFMYITADNSKANLCSHPAASTENLGMNQFNTVVFEGERIDAAKKSISPTLDSRWFNLGCAGGALAKLYLIGHTEAAKAAGFTTTIPERQTALKMFAADYCGAGTPFTVGGQPLNWADQPSEGWMPPTVPFSHVEALWTPDGAACMNMPRLVAHQSANGYAAFPPPAGWPNPPSPIQFQQYFTPEIYTECRGTGHALPVCPATVLANAYHLTSYNP